MVELAIATKVSFLLLEQPEDLGMLARDPYKGQRPASMWQWPAMARVLQLPGVSTLALHQTSFGTDYPKPTRLLLFGPHLFPEFCYLGPPQYDENGYYVGPLPRLHNQPLMRDRATTGPFKTTGTEQWPIRMCQWIAAMLVHSCSATATTAIEGRRAEDEDTLENSDKGYPICQPEGHRLQGGKGPKSMRNLGRLQGLPRRCGAMLTWEMAKAGSGASFVGSEKELEMEAFRMASGGDASWRVARDEGLQQILLGILCKWLEAQDMGEKDLDGIVEGQPLRLRLPETARSRGRP